MPIDTRRQLQNSVRNRSFLNKDFASFRNDLVEYARTYFPDKIRDFGPTGIGGMLVELAAYVGDVQSFYLDHQYRELNPETAIESKNIEIHLRNGGVEIVGSSPSVVECVFYIKIPVAVGSNPPSPERMALPILYAGTIMKAENGVLFELVEDIDFMESDRTNKLKAKIVVGDVDASNNPQNYILSISGFCVSGQRDTETMSVAGFQAFKNYSLSKKDISEIISVTDSAGNEYYEVEHLTNDTVFKGILNVGEDNELVKENLEIIPAPYRFIKSTSLDSRLTTLTFGGGSAETMDSDSIPDPSEFAIPLYGKKTFARFALNPANLLNTETLGSLAPNVSVSISYRYGGGLSHNVERGTIRTLTTIKMGFMGNVSPSVASSVRMSLDVTNPKEASGGDDPPTIDELKLRIFSQKFAQARIVGNQDLLARIYSLPTKFGRVFRAGIRTNPNNSNAATLYIACRDANQHLTFAPDALKKNLSKYINEFRLISDAIDILDAKIINIQVEYTIIGDPDSNRQITLQTINSKLKNYFSIKNFEIDQPIILSNLQNIIYNTDGVVSVQNVAIRNVSGAVGEETYSDVYFDVQSNTMRGGIIIPPRGGIFEIKNTEIDIIGSVM